MGFDLNLYKDKGKLIITQQIDVSVSLLAEVHDFSGNHHHSTAWSGFVVRPRVCVFGFVCNCPDIARFQKYLHWHLHDSRSTNDPVQSFWNLWYPCCDLGIIRKKNKFVIIYSVTMLCYFVIFIIMAAFMIKYPTYLRTECSDPSPAANSIREAVERAN